MACDKPGDGMCTEIDPCGGCGCCSGCGDGCPEPVLPRCQDVQLTPGTFENATIVVNDAGCIAAVTQGEPALYTPDECCGGGSGGGSGATGPRGPKGDPGAAATIAVEEVIGTGTSWTVQNVGTPSAAIFRFTSPASTGVGGSSYGATGEVSGLEVIDGRVTALPDNILTKLTTQEDGFHSDKFVFQKTLEILPNEITVSLNLDALVNYVDAADDALLNRIENLEDLTASLSASVSSLTSALAVLDARVTSLETSGAATSSDFETRLAKVENDLAVHLDPNAGGGA